MVIKKTFVFLCFYSGGGRIGVRDVENVIKDMERERMCRRQLEREKSFPHGEHFHY